LCCSSYLPSEFFYQLSQTCHNLQSISITFNNDDVSNELKELISLQNNLKNLTLSAFDTTSWTSIIPALTKHSNTITKLHFNIYRFEDFKTLQNIELPKLQIL